MISNTSKNKAEKHFITRDISLKGATSLQAPSRGTTSLGATSLGQLSGAKALQQHPHAFDLIDAFGAPDTLADYEVVSDVSVSCVFVVSLWHVDLLLVF